MTHALSRIGASIKALLKFYTHFGAGFVVGSVYVSLLLTFPRLLAIATRLL